MTQNVPGPDVRGTAERLRAVLAAIEAGDLPAEVDQVAYLRGAVAALEQVAEQPAGGVSLPGCETASMPA
ncbi:MAG: hypothetical protein M3Z25_04110 [Actinomycetota bacterium]|nr:hypothetical protein [Actinomycetota bacterium]